MESLLDFGRNFELRDEHHIPSSISENFIKYLDISPDGSKILCAEESNIAKTWDLNQNVLDGYKFYHNDDVGDNTATLSPTKSSQLCVGESIYDFKWYPFMNAADSSTCCFISTSRDHPIHMWDISTGQIRCSYRCYNNMDELEAANSLCFNIMGDKIYAGSNRMIRCFDVANPGRVCLEQPTCKTRRSPIGQRGIISCLSFNPDCSGAYAAGSYANSVSIYVENSQGAALELSGIEFGATYLKWSPCGNNLWVGGRAHDDIVCWDLRQTRSELGRVKRSLSNNQRLVFDLDPWGCYLATGSQDGELLIYDTKTFSLVTSKKISSACVNTARFHPYSSLLFTSSGQRTFKIDMDSSDEEGEGCCCNYRGDADALHDATAAAAAVASCKAEAKGVERREGGVGEGVGEAEGEATTTSDKKDAITIQPQIQTLLSKDSILRSTKGHNKKNTTTSTHSGTASGIHVLSVGRRPASIPDTVAMTVDHYDVVVEAEINNSGNSANNDVSSFVAVPEGMNVEGEEVSGERGGEGEEAAAAMEES